MTRRELYNHLITIGFRELQRNGFSMYLFHTEADLSVSIMRYKYTVNFFHNFNLLMSPISLGKLDVNLLYYALNRVLYNNKEFVKWASDIKLDNILD